MDPVTVVVSIDHWNSGVDDFADFIQSIIRDSGPTISRRISVKVVKDPIVNA